MDSKLILKNPDAAIEQHWGAIGNCSHYDAIVGKVQSINDTLLSTKKLKEQKNQCASQFKSNKENKQLIEKLKGEMKDISEQLNALEVMRKSQNEELLAYFTQADTITEDLMPEQFSTLDGYATEDSRNIRVELIEDNQRQLWNDYATRHPNSALYHLYDWRNIIQNSFQHKSYYFAAMDADNNIVGILPVIRLKSLLFGDYAISMPFFNYGGVIADSPDIAKLMLIQAAQHCREQGIGHLEIRATQKINDWPTKSEKVSMIRSLPETTEELDKQLGSKIRAQINRAKQEKTHTAIGGIDLLDDFYKVFSINMRDLGTPVYSKTFFRNILLALHDRATIVVVYLNKQPVSTAFLLANKDMVEIPWASTLRKTNPLGINMLLYSDVLCHVITSGYHYFDFGRSSIDSNTYKFKKQWGAKPVKHYWHYWLGENSELPELNPGNPKFNLLINIWRKLPVSLTRIIGPSIVKNLP